MARTGAYRSLMMFLSANARSHSRSFAYDDVCNEAETKILLTHAQTSHRTSYRRIKDAQYPGMITHDDSIVNRCELKRLFRTFSRFNAKTDGVDVFRTPTRYRKIL